MIAEMLQASSLAALMMIFAVMGCVWYGLIELVASGRIESEASATLAAVISLVTMLIPAALII